VIHEWLQWPQRVYPSDEICGRIVCSSFEQCRFTANQWGLAARSDRIGRVRDPLPSFPGWLKTRVVREGDVLSIYTEPGFEQPPALRSARPPGNPSLPGDLACGRRSNMSRPLLDVQLPRTRKQKDSKHQTFGRTYEPRSAGLQRGKAVAYPAPLPTMGIESREWDSRTEFGTILLLLRALICWLVVVADLRHTFVQRPETKAPGIDPMLVPAPAALRLLRRECA
jgi:hypothetical protein